MNKINRKEKLIGIIAISLIVVILTILITSNLIIKNGKLSNEGYFTTIANANSNLVAGYIKKGITIGGIEGTLEVLDTSDATAKSEDIAWGKTGYVNGIKITGTRIDTVAQGKEWSGYFNKNTNLSDDLDNNVVIPEGFKIAEDSATKVEDGVVIEDKAKNQFVWVPINDLEKTFQRQEGYFNDIKDTLFPNTGESGRNGINTKITETATTQDEAKKMYASVEKYGGFYVGRYEAGKDENGNVVIRKGVQPYNNIQWSANGQLQETTGTVGGAVELSRNFDNINNYSSVTSTLIYGVQWDAIMNFIDSNYITNASTGNPNCDSNSFIRDSTGKGNYNEDANNNNWKGKVANCGISDNYRVKNIYDLAGNVCEWTMESWSTTNRVNRGGNYTVTGANYTVSNRDRGLRRHS